MDVMNTNIDAFEELEIKCGGERIPLVKKFTLLGILFDEFYPLIIKLLPAFRDKRRFDLKR
jgi:hypothetical protein